MLQDQKQPPQVDLTNKAPNDPTLTEPQEVYIAIHAAASRIAWMSGAADIWYRSEEHPDDSDLKGLSDELIRGWGEEDEEKFLNLAEREVREHESRTPGGPDPLEDVPQHHVVASH